MITLPSLIVFAKYKKVDGVGQEREHVLGAFGSSAKTPQKSRLETEILRENFGAGERDRTGDVQIGNFLLNFMFCSFAAIALS
jgi:hypothetical protein